MPKSSETKQSPKLYHRREKATGGRTVQRYAVVSADVRQMIVAYCRSQKISVSEFLTDMVLSEVDRPKPRKPLTITITLEPEDAAKVEYQCKLLNLTPSELIKRVLIPQLEKQKMWSKTKQSMVRYCVTKGQDRIIRKYMKQYRLWPRHYVGLLAEQYFTTSTN